VRRWKPAELLPLQSAYLEAGQALGFARVADHNHLESTGIGPWPMNQRDGMRISTATAYRLPARDRSNLNIRADTLVNRVVVERGRAVGVEIAGGEIVRGDRITLSARAIASPAILLRSGIGPRADLEALGIAPVLDAPGVGANLIDHPVATVGMVPVPGVCEKSQPVVQVGIRYTAPGSSVWNDMQLYMLSQVDLTETPAMMPPPAPPWSSRWRPRSSGRSRGDACR